MTSYLVRAVIRNISSSTGVCRVRYAGRTMPKTVPKSESQKYSGE